MRHRQLVSVCCFFQYDSHPLPCLILGTGIKEFLVVASQNTQFIIRTQGKGRVTGTLGLSPADHPGLRAEVMS